MPLYKIEKLIYCAPFIIHMIFITITLIAMVLQVAYWIAVIVFACAFYTFYLATALISIPIRIILWFFRRL